MTDDENEFPQCWRCGVTSSFYPNGWCGKCGSFGDGVRAVVTPISPPDALDALRDATETYWAGWRPIPLLPWWKVAP